MLVINANNQQDTTNCMLTDPQYPDVNQILMYWGPVCQASWDSAGWRVPTFPILKTIWTTNINYFCPKIYRQGLLEWNFSRVDYRSVAPDIWRITWGSTSGLAESNGIWLYEYIIAVNWLKAGQIIWEHIIAPIAYVSTNRTIKFTSSDDMFALDFFLLHTDWTTTNITTLTTPTVSCWYWSIVSLPTIANWWNLEIFTFKYDWIWQTAQDDDILCCKVHLWATRQVWFSQGRYWQCYGGTNNNSITDINGFRPFQVSIRDA